jgi:predicted RNA binding protein YcfA (HicA-like mRNA interferase family)
MAQHGFKQVRRKGSHIILQKATGNSTITVPVPDHDELKLGTLTGIIRQSGLPRSLFEQ